jgi:hypothetical protein
MTAANAQTRCRSCNPSAGRRAKPTDPAPTVTETQSRLEERYVVAKRSK